MTEGQRLIPLFPLNTVLFPGGPLALRIFEPRYLDMISRCLREQVGFGVALIREGAEVGEAASTHEVGTYGSISYWARRPDGLLGITLRGERRFRIVRTETRPDRLLMAEIEFLPDLPERAVPMRFDPLVELLRSILDGMDHPYVTLPRHYQDASWVAGRLAELLPLAQQHKQRLLTLNEPLEQLHEIQKAIATGHL